LIRHSDLPDPVAMATLAKKIEVETRMREMLEAEGTPLPDRVEYGDGCVRLFWTESKTVLVIDIDDPGEGDESLDGLDAGPYDWDPTGDDFDN
jgi:hypothetical protein